jgi:hypothetical protein
MHWGVSFTFRNSLYFQEHYKKTWQFLLLLSKKGEVSVTMTETQLIYINPVNVLEICGCLLL